MFRLASILYAIVGTSCAGIAIIASLTMGYDTLQPILVAAAIGAGVALPVTWFVTQKVLQQ